MGLAVSRAHKKGRQTDKEGGTRCCLGSGGGREREREGGRARKPGEATTLQIVQGCQARVNIAMGIAGSVAGEASSDISLECYNPAWVRTIV